MEENLLSASEVAKRLSTETKRLGTKAINEGIKSGVIQGYIQYAPSGRYRFFIQESQLGAVENAWKEGKLGQAGGWSDPEPFDPAKHGELIRDYEKKMTEFQEERKKLKQK